MVNRPLNLTGRFDAADNDIAGFEFGRSRAHQITNEGWLPMGIHYSPIDAMAHWELVERGDVTTDIFLDDPSARTATLGILRLRGDWDAANPMEQEIIGPGSPLRSPLFAGEEIPKTDERAERRITLDWGVVSVNGLTMVATQRRILQTPWVVQTLRGHKPDTGYLAHTSYEVDKRSTFALDIKHLADIDPDAAREVRLIIICGMIATTDINRLNRAITHTLTIDDLQNDAQATLEAEKQRLLYARNKMQQYGIGYDEVIRRAFGGDVTVVQHPATRDAIESEIAEPTGLLIPSTVTYYGERTLHRRERL